MRLALVVLIGLGWLSGSGCGRESLAREWRVMFGPVISTEVIVGHIIRGPTVWLLTDAPALVRVDLDGRRFARARVATEGETIWGLAAMDQDEGVWTLLGRSMLARLSEEGEITRRIPLPDPHVGVFGVGPRLAYQVMNFQPPAEALSAGLPGHPERAVWSAMRTRALPLARTAVAALNLVSCGSSSTGVIPCWFPDQPVVTMTDRTGHSRSLTLEGLPTVAPEVLLASENPRRPIRDAFVSGPDALWVLGSGEAADEEVPVRPGGWLLARYDAQTGRLLRRLRLPQPARLVLGARGDRCLLLAWDGRVVEIRP